MTLLKFLSALLFVGVAILTCTTSPAPSPISEPVASATPTIEKASTSSQDAWDKVISQAKKERKITAYVSTLPANTYRPISQAFEGKYGITVEFIAGRGMDIMQRVVAEQRAGVNTGDVYETGVTTHILLHERGYLEAPISLPETANVSNWMIDPWRLSAKDKFMFDYYEYTPGPVINTDIIKPSDELKSWLDLGNPKWKGKIAWDDPSVPGPGARWMSVAKWYMGADFWEKLANNNITFIRDRVFLYDSVIRGRYPIAMGVFTTAISQGIKDGAPIKALYLKEGSPGGGWAVSILKNAPHPNAAKLFLNWFLSKEGQLVFSQGAGVASFRKDVPQDLVHPSFRVTPDMKIVTLTPEQEAQVQKDMVLAAEFFKISR